jgi:hypothetical protein
VASAYDLADTQQLTQVFLSNAKMQAQSQHQKCARRFRSGDRISTGIRSGANDFLSNPTIGVKGAIRFQDRQNRFERISVNLRHSSHVSCAIQGVPMLLIAKAIPIGARRGDLITRYKAGDWAKVSRKLRRLS